MGELLLDKSRTGRTNACRVLTLMEKITLIKVYLLIKSVKNVPSEGKKYFDNPNTFIQ